MSRSNTLLWIFDGVCLLRNFEMTKTLGKSYRKELQKVADNGC